MTSTSHRSYSVWDGSEGALVLYVCTLPGEAAASEGGSWSGWDPREPPRQIGLDPEQ